MNLSSCAARAIFTAAMLWTGAASAAGDTAKPAPESLRPPMDMLIPCDQLPKDAVIRLQPDLAAWATVYCTKYGQIFNANESHFGAFPDNGVRATLGAAQFDGKSGDAGASSYFASIKYVDFPAADLQALLKVDPITAKITTGKPLKKLELATKAGNAATFLVIDPASDPFWVFPLTDKGLGSPAFFVTTLAAINRKR